MDNPQTEAYVDCAKNGIEEGYEWAAFFDIDEYLQLKRHDDMVDLLEEHLSSGALGVNWYVFRPRKEDVLYKPLPLPKRSMFREVDPYRHIKSIVKLSDMDLGRSKKMNFIHAVMVRKGKLHDTNNHPFQANFNANGPTDVVVLHHYAIKSYKEFLAKRLRGRAAAKSFDNSARIESAQEHFLKALDPNDTSSNDIQVDTKSPHINIEVVYDDSGWEAMKKYAPQYAFYDDLVRHQL